MVLIPFVGTDPDATTNVYSYFIDKKTCIINELNKEWGHNKGILHATQYRPTSFKEQKTTLANCTNFAGTATMSNPEDKVATIPINTYKVTCWRHMILHGMWDVFRILDPFDTAKAWYLFHRTALFTLLTVVSHVG